MRAVLGHSEDDRLTYGRSRGRLVRAMPSCSIWVGIMCCLFMIPSIAAADVQITGDPLRTYRLPGGGFEIAGATVQAGAGGVTVISNNSGSEASAACTVVIAADDGATAYEYQFEGRPTLCSGVLAHPAGGFFIRGFDPTAEDGDVTGFTAFIDQDGQEVWKVPDQLLVDATPEPSGTGEFLGRYFTPLGVMAYSPELDKLLAFTAGQLTIGQDVKVITQAHVLGGEQGVLSVSGQTFGQSGVGIPGAVVVRDDGKFVIYYYAPGARGADYFVYNGRNEIDFLNPGNQDWDLRYVFNMVYGDRSLHFVWADAEGVNAGSYLTVTNDEGALFFANSYDATYRFADGETAILGPPTNLWLTEQYNVVSYVGDGEVWLRFVDQNGESPGMGRLSGIGEGIPASLVAYQGELRLLTYDEFDRKVVEWALSFEDVDPFDPNKPPDMGVPDIGFGDVLEEATGCSCRSVATPLPGSGGWGIGLVFGLVGLLLRKR